VLYNQGVLHALCNAHHLRELKARVEIENEEWARKMQKLLRRACHAVNRAHERGVWLKPALVELFHQEYDSSKRASPSMRLRLPLPLRTRKGAGTSPRDAAGLSQACRGRGNSISVETPSRLKGRLD
jgi:hypothetical protein